MKRAIASILFFVSSLSVYSLAIAQTSGMDKKDMPMGNMKEMPVGNMKNMPIEKGAQAATHKGTGTVKQVDASLGKVTVVHEPIPSLKWPAMTMDFEVADKKLLERIQPGAKVHFEFKEKSKGKYIITEMKG